MIGSGQVGFGADVAEGVAEALVEGRVGDIVDIVIVVVVFPERSGGGAGEAEAQFSDLVPHNRRLGFRGLGLGLGLE